MITRLGRMLTIERVLVKYGLETLFLNNTRLHALQHVFVLSPTRWLSQSTRELPRGQRIRLALEELGPVFVKLGQMLSTRRDLLPDDIGDELALLQDQVPPFSESEARQAIEKALGDSVDELFETFSSKPLASASVAQVHEAKLKTGEDVVVKVLRPNIEKVINRDVALMYAMADLLAFSMSDARRLKPREVVAEYDQTIHNELNLVQEASNAVVIKNNFKNSKLLYIPEVHWEYVRTNVLVIERIYGIPIREVDEMKRIGMDMKKLAENAVEIFYTQLFQHNFFHADMHPGNIFVSSEHLKDPSFIAVDFGIVGSLTEEDQRYLGENMLAFFRSDYRRVAQLHVDSGWVPAHTKVGEFESAIRAVCEPIFEKPLSEISFGAVLLQLFQTARRFEMEVQPQLVLLQKTLLNIEGLGRDLYPDLDLWATAKPFLEDWVKEKRGPKALLNKVIDQAPQIIDAMPYMPMLVHDYLKHNSQNNTLSAQRNNQNIATSSSSKSVKYTIAGSAVLLSGTLLGAANLMSLQVIPWWAIVLSVLGAALLGAGLLLS